MNRPRIRNLLRLVLGTVFLLQLPAGNSAPEYPSKPVRFVAPFAPGGSADILTRTIGHKLSERWGQPVVTDNRPGAGGNIGTEIVAKAAPDGYTLLLAAPNHAINASLYRRLPYDPVKDFAPVILLSTAPFVLVVPRSMSVKSVKDLVALAKSKPGELNYASGGSGTGGHLAAELFKSLAGIAIVHIPYKGSGQALTALLGAQVHLSIPSLISAMPHVKSAKLRALAVTTGKRTRALPETPTMSEAGVTGYETSTWYGVLAPVGTPSALINNLNKDMSIVLAGPDVRERISGDGGEIVAGTPAQFLEFIKSEVAKYAKIVKKSGLRLD